MFNRNEAILRYPLSWRSWRFRLVLGMVVLVLVVRVVWGWEARRMLQRQLDAARSRGEPVRVEDVKFDEVPDGENAWKMEMKAAATMAPGVWSPRYGNDEYKDYPPYSTSWMHQVDAVEKANKQAFALARQARALGRARVRDRLKTPLMEEVTSLRVSDSSQLACMLTDGALYSHVRGDDLEALERIGDALHVAHSLRRDPFLTSQLVAMRIDSLGCSAAQIIGPGLQLEPVRIARPAMATKAQVRELIAKLLDEEPIWRGLESCLPMERLVEEDFLKTASRDELMIRPLADFEAVRANRYLEIAIHASHLRNRPALQALLARAKVEEPVSNPLSSMLGGKKTTKMPRYSRWYLVWSGDLSRYFDIIFRGLAERRMTAISLAAQLYRSEHGDWPANLDVLIPDYLPAVPKDPFYEDGRSVGYLILKQAVPGGADRPLLFIDVGGIHSGPVPAEPTYSWQSSLQSGTQYRDLSRFTPAPPSAQAVDGDPEKSDEPGK